MSAYMMGGDQNLFWRRAVELVYHHGQPFYRLSPCGHLIRCGMFAATVDDEDDGRLKIVPVLPSPVTHVRCSICDRNQTREIVRRGT